MERPILEVEKINTFYGDSHILFDVSLNVKEGEIVTLLGRNGVGKTTTLRSIMGLTPPHDGIITYDGREISKDPVYVRTQIGMGYVPEYRGIFPKLTVAENLMLAAAGSGTKTYEYVFEYFPVMRDYLNTAAGNLSGGEQQMLAIGRALLGKKKLLILDEPTQGLAPMVAESLVSSFHKIRMKTSILLVEQNVNLALGLADRVYIMRDGHIVFEGAPQEVKEKKELQDYLAVA
ncbi:MAG: ABC transporter ATP-binding protein [Candidatus Bathyarchaeota archaeon]|nr:ABC transporter ATP-binding protein [Candidatus Bathyarchaeota archaeon]